jgi:branched-chain amino acid aminotransferase
MNECFGNNFILNGEMLPAELFDNSLIYEGDSIYEVIRMIKGFPVFFHDHMERLENSVRHQNKKLLSGRSQVKNDIIRLTRSDRRKEANLKIVFNYNNGIDNYIIYFIEPIYPTALQYKIGVKGILYNAQRKDPESKVINHKLRSDIYHKLILENAYEALLVNNQNYITEGSRSNVFFVKGTSLITPPDNLVLNGITRKHILEICRENDIEVKYNLIRTDEMAGFNAVFMTGTSPMVLPFCCIGDVHFRVDHQVIDQLRSLYVKRAISSTRLFNDI